MLVLLYIVGLPHIETTNLFGASGENLFPGGMKGIWAAFPFAMWLFTGLEMLPMLAEETTWSRVSALEARNQMLILPPVEAGAF